jgi:hypothetical protein
MPPPSHQAAFRSRDRSPRCPMPPPSRQARSRPRGRSPRCRSRSRHHRSRSRRGSSDCRSRFDRGPEPVAPTPRQARGSNRGRGANRDKAANNNRRGNRGRVRSNPGRVRSQALRVQQHLVQEKFEAEFEVSARAHEPVADAERASAAAAGAMSDDHAPVAKAKSRGAPAPSSKSWMPKLRDATNGDNDSSDSHESYSFYSDSSHSEERQPEVADPTPAPPLASRRSQKSAALPAAVAAAGSRVAAPPPAPPPVKATRRTEKTHIATMSAPKLETRRPSSSPEAIPMGGASPHASRRTRGLDRARPAVDDRSPSRGRRGRPSREIAADAAAGSDGRQPLRMLTQLPHATAPGGGGRHRHHGDGGGDRRSDRRRNRADSSSQTEGEAPVELVPSAVRRSVSHAGVQIGRFIRDMPGMRPMTLNQLRQAMVQIQPILDLGIVTGYGCRERRGA